MNADDEILTEDLLEELLNSPDATQFCASHDSTDMNLSTYLSTLLAEKGKRKIDVIHDANLNETFGYQIFSGERMPKRDKALQLAFGMACSVREAQRLLKHAGCNELYVKNRRDAIILFCIEHGQSLQETDALLYRFGEHTVQSENA